MYKLKISVISYNRPNSLNKIYDRVSSYLSDSICLFVSDDSDIENSYLKEESLKSKHFEYSYNTIPLGHDKNIIHSLSNFDSDYVWLIGDSIIPNDFFLKNIISYLKNDLTGIVLSSNTPRLNFGNTKLIDSYNFLFDNFLWFCTQTGSTIYRSSLLKRLFDTKKLTYSENFSQVHLFFLTQRNHVRVLYIPYSCFSVCNMRTGSYWYRSIIKVFSYDYYNLVYSLSPNKNYNITTALRSHDCYTKLFNSKIFYYCLGKSFINKKNVHHYYGYLDSVTDVNRIVFLLKFRFLFSLFSLFVDLYFFTKNKLFNYLFNRY